MRIKFLSFGVLLLLSIGFATIFNGGLQAQSEVHKYKTSEEVARDFIILVASPYSQFLEEDFSWLESKFPFPFGGKGTVSAMISAKSFEQLGQDGVAMLTLQMGVLVRQPDWKTSTQAASDSAKATVKLTPDDNPVREVVCVRENDAWRVDLLATYAKWFRMEEKDVKQIAMSQREEDRRTQCQSNLKRIALAMMQYSQDYDETFPPAKEWAEVIQPYLESSEIFKCPSAPNNGYAYNWKLSKNTLSDVGYISSQVMVYESNKLSLNQSGEGQDIAYRHLEGTNLLFVDGHVKWLHKTSSLTSNEWHFTFLPAKVNSQVGRRLRSAPR